MARPRTIEAARLLRRPAVPLAIVGLLLAMLELAGVPTGWSVHLHSDPAREAMWLGQYGQAACVGFIAVAIALLDADGRRRAATLVVAVLLAGGVATAIKVTAGRVRPHQPHAGAFLGPAAPAAAANRSFPSGHTAAAFATSAVLAAFYPRGRRMFWTLAAACGALRWTQDAHWLSDVLVGASVGLASATPCLRYVARLEASAVNAVDRPAARVETPIAPPPTLEAATFDSSALPARVAKPSERAWRWVSTIACVALIATVAFRVRPPESPAREGLEHAGFALLIVAAFGRAWSDLYLHGRGERTLCRAGPYSLTRHPAYLFTVIGAVGFAMALESYALPAVAAAALLAHYHVAIEHEEFRLAAAFGGDFDAYRREVPRLLPRLRGYRDESSLTLSPRLLGRTLLSASLFAWAIVAVEVSEQIAHANAVPSFWHIP